MTIISFSFNNQQTLKLIQRRHDGATLIIVEDADGSHEPLNDNEAFISPSDFAMLINYFRYIKSHDCRHNFINPNGANIETD